MAEITLDILAFGAHADDVEIGMGASIAKYAKLGKKIGICDLSNAELSSNGTVEIRKKEAQIAADILGVTVRETIGLPDRGLFPNPEYIRKITEVIRKYRPKLVFAPYFQDRHPDHGQCARLVEEAVFSAGIKKYASEDGFEPHRVKNLYFYMINGFHEPDFVIDVTGYMDKKIESLNAYASQFIKDEKTFNTPLVNGYIETIEARERLFGKEVEVAYAEGFKRKKPVIINLDLFGERE
ncbi:bacillithiol biosynthesis deacetylase BshB1 [Cytobacillus depressus]|uniref:Bacillithiol biosynthesis deacetylase BshB1 n=2 Tax=Cytobacillus depressus TaxID=1602942 RepID=A0A6L3VBJ2_9BACI|nr:bacillithiol biosynthesis deacetylase BshB1 [Cytobacillus depressus]KAB2338960.1 bacillithiol biosynthesis deacetylase BshB1 [Cytobacillus depressus]